MPIYMQFDGAPGGVTASGKFDSWAPLTGFQFGLDREFAMEQGSKLSLAKGPPRLTQFTVMKNLEEASMPLMQCALTASSGVKAKIAVTSERNDSEYLVYELEDVMIASYDVSSSGEGPIEVIGLTFAKITATFLPFDSAHRGASKLEAEYDLKKLG